MPHWLRMYDGLAIWMTEEPERTVESPDVQAQLDRRGALWLRCFSTVCPDGECGYVAVGGDDDAVVAITAAAFAEARERGWQLPAAGVRGVEQHPAEAFRPGVFSSHPAHRVDAVLEPTTYGELRAGDFITAEPEMGERARWVKVTGVHGHGMLTVGIETPVAEGRGEDSRFVIDRMATEQVVVDATSRGVLVDG